MCFVCENKFYKDFERESCQVCPYGAECINGIIHNLEGLLIFISCFYYFKGFWRESEFSSKLYECFPFKENCIGNKINPHEICEKKYRGPLCQICNKNYAGLYCAQCYSQNTNFLIISLSILALTIVLGVYIKFTS